MYIRTSTRCLTQSPSSRRAWVEIWLRWATTSCLSRSPSSRRAWVEIMWFTPRSTIWPVALLAEGVGRNFNDPAVARGYLESPSSRRAWVEIVQLDDRPGDGRSPSSRRAWVEIALPR